MGKLRKALAEPHPLACTIANRLYSSAKRFPNGHKHLQGTTNSLGTLLVDLGRYQEAAEVLDDALAMAEKLYSKERFPNGTEHFLQTLNTVSYTHLTLPTICSV